MSDFFNLTQIDLEALQGDIVKGLSANIAGIDELIATDELTDRQRKQLQKQRDRSAVLYQKYSGDEYPGPQDLPAEHSRSTTLQEIHR